MENIYIVFKCDTWHTQASRLVIGACTDIESAISLCIEYAEKEGQEIQEEELQFLSEKLQTQNYEGEGEFIIQKVPANTLVLVPYNEDQHG
jgi:hypothetical protein